MATRKSGDGSRDADQTGASPGSYVKVSGSRRKRKNKRRSIAPGAETSLDVAPSSSEQSIGDVLDTEGEDTSDELGRQTRPDWGAGERVHANHEVRAEASDADDHSVDDLRRKPTSSRAPRRPHGPLGMEGARVEAVARSEITKLDSPLAPAPASNVSSAARMKVIEINPPESDNTNASREEDADGDPNSYELAELGREEASAAPELIARNSVTRDYAAAPRSADSHAPALRSSTSAHADSRNTSQPPAPSRERTVPANDVVPRSLVPAARARATEIDDESDDEEVNRILNERLRESDLAPRHSLSSVLGARPSMRPSPLPPPDKISPLWWGMVTLLSAIIIAAGVIALRESMHEPTRQPVAAETTDEPTERPAPALRTPSTPSTPSASPSAASPSAASPSAASPSAASPSPDLTPKATTSAATPTPPAAATSPVGTAPTAVTKPPPAAAQIAAPVASTPKPQARPTPTATTRPSLRPASRPTATRPNDATRTPAPATSPEAAAAAAAAAAATVTPPPAPVLEEARLPVNPYAE